MRGRPKRASHVRGRHRGESGPVEWSLNSNPASYECDTNTAARNLSPTSRTESQDTKGKRDLVRFQGARGEGAMAWVTCQGTHR